MKTPMWRWRHHRSDEDTTVAMKTPMWRWRHHRSDEDTNVAMKTPPWRWMRRWAPHSFGCYALPWSESLVFGSRSSSCNAVYAGLGYATQRTCRFRMTFPHIKGLDILVLTSWLILMSRCSWMIRQLSLQDVSCKHFQNIVWNGILFAAMESGTLNEYERAANRWLHPRLYFSFFCAAGAYGVVSAILETLAFHTWTPYFDYIVIIKLTKLHIDKIKPCA